MFVGFTHCISYSLLGEREKELAFNKKIYNGVEMCKTTCTTLCEIRMTASTTIKLPLFKILMGRPFYTPWAKGNYPLTTTRLLLKS